MTEELTGTIVMIAFVIMLIAVAMSAYFSYGMVVSILDDIKKRKERK